MVCFSCTNYSLSETQKTSFLKYFALDIEDNEGSDVIQTLDGGYIILSNFNRQEIQDSDKDIMIVFCNEFGNKSNNSPIYLGTNGYDRGNSIIRSGDGYIVVGSSLVDSIKLGYMARINNTGQLIWQHNYGGYAEMEFNEVIQHQDGGYILTGYVRGFNEEDDKEVILFKTDATGDSLWSREMGYDGYDDVGESLEKYQGRLLVVGTTSSPDGSENSKLLVLNTNLDGRGVFPLRISGNEDLSGQEILLDPGGDLYVMGNDENILSGASKVYIAKLMLAGSVLEEVEIGEYKYLDDLNSIWGMDMESTESGGMAICGWESIQNDINIYFAMFDRNLQLIHRRTYGSNGYQAASCMNYAGDGGFCLSGSVNLGGGRTTMLLKLSSEGELH
jgi:hypothetical protein